MICFHNFGLFFLSPNSIALAQERVTLDLSNLGMINQILVNVVDNCNFDYTSAAIFTAPDQLVDQAANQTFNSETLVLTNPQQLPIDYMYFQSFQGSILKVSVSYTSLRQFCTPNPVLAVGGGNVYAKS